MSAIYPNFPGPNIGRTCPSSQEHGHWWPRSSSALLGHSTNLTALTLAAHRSPRTRRMSERSLVRMTHRGRVCPKLMAAKLTSFHSTSKTIESYKIKHVLQKVFECVVIKSCLYIWAAYLHLSLTSGRCPKPYKLKEEKKTYSLCHQPTALISGLTHIMTYHNPSHMNLCTLVANISG